MSILIPKYIFFFRPQGATLPYSFVYDVSNCYFASMGGLDE
jgi:hypothetical protein